MKLLKYRLSLILSLPCGLALCAKVRGEES